MGISNLRAFLQEVVREAREPAASYIALKLAGRFGKDDPHARCWNLAQSDADRALMADTIIWTIDDAITHFFMFLELKIDSEIFITLKKNGVEYQVNGCDMLQAWYGVTADEVGKVTAESLVKDVEAAAQQGK